MKSSASPTDRIFRFGQVELSEREGVLGKNGVRIKVQEQPFRVLVELLVNAGKLVTREELQQKLWPADTFVDFDVGLNTAIQIMDGRTLYPILRLIRSNEAGNA